MSNTILKSPLNTTDSGTWLRGNLHTHTTISDGAENPQTMIQSYADLGHDFLFISDHDSLADYSNLDPCGLILIKGNEVTASGPHILDVGAKVLVPATPDRQTVINQINTESGFAVLNHPNNTFSQNHYPYELMLELKDYTGIEIFNAKALSSAGSHLGLNRWDRLLAEKGMVWGFANDDSHDLSIVGSAWNVVWAKDKSGDAILEALKNGSFYASTGVEIIQLEVKNSKVHVVTANADKIIVVGKYGKRLFESNGHELIFDTSECLSPYLRIECYGSGEKMAWTQPIQIANGLSNILQDNLNENPTYSVSRVEIEPNMTGKTVDPLWDSIQPSRDFMSASNPKAQTMQTNFKAVFAQEKLFLSIYCEEPELDKLRMNVKDNGNPKTWTDDSVEIFLDLDHTGKDYFQIMLNAAGYYACSSFDSKRKEPLIIKTKVAREENAWTLEISISLANLGLHFPLGKEFGFHIVRNRKIGLFTSSLWTYVGESNHSPRFYGTLTI
ncbi:MAG: hypothetical protein COA79_15640 [Planctomycetota bacterium]|nr:MAG: hypothetical protein COA79_15640 [Planctomycetota bacterium]